MTGNVCYAVRVWPRIDLRKWRLVAAEAQAEICLKRSHLKITHTSAPTVLAKQREAVSARTVGLPHRVRNTV